MGQQKIVDGLDTNIKWAAFLFTKNSHSALLI